MAIPGSGKVSIGDIRTELQNTGSDSFSLKLAGRPITGSPGTFIPPQYVPINQSSTSKPNNVSPYAISEWRNYDHTENLPCPANFTSPNLGLFYTYYRLQITGQTSYQSIISVTGNSTFNHNIFIYTSYPFDSIGQLVISPWEIGYFTSTETKTFTRTMLTTSEVLHIVICELGY
jgi:hypothetical protein